MTRVGFFPFQIEDSARFFPGHDLVACNSGIYAGKSREARNTFNAKVTAYHIGRVWFKMLRPDLAPRIEHLRDINPEHLGLAAGSLPAARPVAGAYPRTKVQAAFGQMAEAERDRLERMFLSHEAPADGYAVRGVVLFGLSEMARAQRCLGLLKRNDARGLGRLMNRSHDGDRVSRETSRNTWRRVPAGSADGPLTEWSRAAGAQGGHCRAVGRIRVQPAGAGPHCGYRAAAAGVEGAQLAGAGLGGCIMVLVQKPHTADLLKTLGEQGVQAEVFRPIAGACSLMMGELKQPGLAAFASLQPELLVAQLRGDAALGRALQVAFHDEVRLIDFFQGVRFLAHRHRHRAEADRAAAELRDHGFQDALVHLVEAVLVDFQHRERLVGDVRRDAAFVSDLGVIAHAAKEVVGNARCAAAAAGDFPRALFLSLDVQQPGGADDDLLEFVGLVIVEPLANGEAGEQRRGEQAAAGGRANKREAGQIEPDAASVGPWSMMMSSLKSSMAG